MISYLRFYVDAIFNTGDKCVSVDRDHSELMFRF
jgi:hypothetical protein